MLKILGLLFTFLLVTTSAFAQELRIGSGANFAVMQSKGRAQLHAGYYHDPEASWSINVDYILKDYTYAFFLNLDKNNLKVRYGNDKEILDASVHSPTLGMRMEFTNAYIFSGSFCPYIGISLMYQPKGSTYTVTGDATTIDFSFKTPPSITNTIDPVVTVRGGARSGLHPIVSIGLVTEASELGPLEYRIYFGAEYRLTRQGVFEFIGPGTPPEYESTVRKLGFGLQVGLVLAYPFYL